MPNFTNNKINQAYESFMQQVPGFHRDPPEARSSRKIWIRALRTSRREAARMIFRNDNHGVTFEKEIKYHNGCSRRFAAALFLLTADTRLWLQAENHVGSHEIDIAAIKPPPPGRDGLCLLYAGQGHHHRQQDSSSYGAGRLRPHVPRYFMVIQTAMLIRGYGLSAANRLTFKTA